MSAVNTIPKYRAMVSKLTAEESSVAGMTASQGPTLSGCTIASKTELTLHFNESLLGAGEQTGAGVFPLSLSLCLSWQIIIVFHMKAQNTLN